MTKGISVIKKLLLILTLTACTTGGYRYGHYETIGSEGWERTDTIVFTVGPVRHFDSYTAKIGLRTDSYFPFMQLTLIVGQEAYPSGFTRKDTLTVSLTDDEGYVFGDGISHYQYLVPLAPINLNAGDTLRVSVCHDMLRSPLAGVTDIGFMLE